MQAPTHVLTGVLIEKVFNGVRAYWLRVALIAVTGLFLHSVLDRLARLTFHPPRADFHDAFWAGYHLLVLVGFVISLYYFWKPYNLGIIFSILPDFDWVIIHGKNILGIEYGFYDRPFIHHFIYSVTDRIPPFSWLRHLPDLTHWPWASLGEVMLVCALVYIIINEPFPWREDEETEIADEEV